MRARLMQFFYGRNGQDALCRFLYVISLVFCVIALLSKWMVFYYIAIVMLALCLFRTLSKNLYKRQQENNAYLGYKYKVTAKASGIKSRFKQMKAHRFYKCPSCKQQLRVPRGKGNLSITCPKCHTSFVKRT